MPENKRHTIAELEALIESGKEINILPSGQVELTGRELPRELAKPPGYPRCVKCHSDIEADGVLVGEGDPENRKLMHTFCAAESLLERVLKAAGRRGSIPTRVCRPQRLGEGEEVRLMLESQRSQEMRKRADAILQEHVKDDETGFGWCRAQMCYAFGMSWPCQVYEMAKLLEDALDSAMLAEHRLRKKAPNAR
jgi:hypothetical protein